VGPLIFTEDGLIGFKSGPDRMTEKQRFILTSKEV